MEGYLPTSVIPLAQCYIINKDSFLKEKEGVDITVCCSDGRVVEFCDKNVVDFCDIPFLKSASINTFYAYEPLLKYYIIQENSDVIVLKKTECDLKSVRKFSCVQNYEISDFLKLGKPQVKIWLADEMEPVVTDFSDSLYDSLNHETSLSLNLDSRLNTMKLYLEEVNKNYENKKLCCDNALSNFKRSVKKSCRVKSKKSWQKVVDDNCIFSLFIENISDYLLTNLHLLNEDLLIETKILKLADSSDDHKSFEVFNSVKCLDPGSAAYVVGILSVPDPNFKFCKVIQKSFSLLYNIEMEHETNLEEIKLLFELDMMELINGKLELFNTSDVLIEDVITIMVINEEIILELNFKNNTIGLELDKILIKELHFYKININGIVPSTFIIRPQSNSYLSRFMLFVKQLTPSSYLFKCYVKDSKHLSLFLNVLGNFTSIVSIRQKNKSFKDEIPILAAVNTLDDEFKHFSSIMKCAIPVLSLPLQDESSLRFTTDTWRQLLESRLQFDTDSKFQNALLENNNNLCE